MSEPEYTKGPWTVKFSKFNEIVTEDGAIVAKTTKLTTLTNMEANSRLISAAPDLHEALRCASALLDNPIMRRKHEMDGFYEETVDLMRKALAKTIGKTYP